MASSAGRPAAVAAHQGGYWVATGHPQIVVDLETLGARRQRACVDLELVREWRRRPASGAGTAAGTSARTRRRPRRGVGGPRCDVGGPRCDVGGPMRRWRPATRRWRQERRRWRPRRRRRVAARRGAPRGARAAARRRPAGGRGVAAAAGAAPLAAHTARRRHARSGGRASRRGARRGARVRRSSAPSAGPAAPLGPSAAPALHYVLAPAGRWPSPLVSIVLPLDDPAAPDAGAVQAWLAAQTCQACELIAWSPRAGRAWPIDTRDAASAGARLAGPGRNARRAPCRLRHASAPRPTRGPSRGGAAGTGERGARPGVGGPFHATPALDAGADGPQPSPGSRASTPAPPSTRPPAWHAAAQPRRRSASTSSTPRRRARPPLPGRRPPLPADLQWTRALLVAGSPGTAATAPSSIHCGWSTRR